MNKMNSVDIKYFHSFPDKTLYGLTVTCCGFQTILPFENYPPNTHPVKYNFDRTSGRILDEYQVLYITSGKGVLIVDNIIYKVSTGNVIILFPGQYHTYYPYNETGWGEYYIGFKGDIVDNLITNSFLSKTKPIANIGFNNELVSLYKSAIEMISTDEQLMQYQLEGLVMHLLGLLIYESQNVLFEKNKYTELMENAKIIMNQHIYDYISMEEIAEKLNLSYNTFRKMFKSHSGYGPAGYLKKLKIKKAKQYLVESNMSIKEIAYKLGYNCPESFIISFKMLAGESPTKYRNKARIETIEKV